MAIGGAAELADADLVERAREGDRDAFEVIYCRYQAIVYRFARSMAGSTAIAEDVTQEVFVALISDLARYDPERARLSTYLYGVTRNVTRARLRREPHVVNLDDLSSNGFEPLSPDDPSDALARSQDLLRLREAIFRLPSRYREVVILCALHELSYTEAAEVIGVTVSAVRSRLHRGRTLLAERLRSSQAAVARIAPGRAARCLA